MKCPELVSKMTLENSIRVKLIFFKPELVVESIAINFILRVLIRVDLLNI